jgi:hypothetical protein
VEGGVVAVLVADLAAAADSVDSVVGEGLVVVGEGQAGDIRWIFANRVEERAFRFPFFRCPLSRSNG